jgi:hypothetical protein
MTGYTDLPPPAAMITILRAMPTYDNAHNLILIQSPQMDGSWAAAFALTFPAVWTVIVLSDKDHDGIVQSISKAYAAAEILVNDRTSAIEVKFLQQMTPLNPDIVRKTLDTALRAEVPTDLDESEEEVEEEEEALSVSAMALSPPKTPDHAFNEKRKRLPAEHPAPKHKKPKKPLRPPPARTYQDQTAMTAALLAVGRDSPSTPSSAASPVHSSPPGSPYAIDELFRLASTPEKA